MGNAAKSRPHWAKPHESLPAFPAYFASSQRSIDIFQSVFILTLGQACQCIRVVQSAVCDSAASAAAPREETPATLAGFPCDGGDIEQGFWVLAHFPWLAWVLARDFYWFELPWTVVLETVILVAAILQPRWYLQGGRTVLYPLLRIGIAGLVFLEILLAPPNPILLATASVCYLGSKGVMFLFFTVLCKTFPLRLHALTCACTWLLMALYNVTYCCKHGGSIPGVLVTSLTAQLVVGVAVPVLAARFQNRSLLAAYQALQDGARGTWGFQWQASTMTIEAARTRGWDTAMPFDACSCMHASRWCAPDLAAFEEVLSRHPVALGWQVRHRCEAPPEAAPEAAPEAPPEPPPEAPPEAPREAALEAAPEAPPEASREAAGGAASEAAGEECIQAPGNKVDTAVPAHAANRGGAAAAPAAVAQVPGGKPEKRMYRPVCNTLLVSIKIYHHEAYDNRSAILAAVEERLHASCSPPTTSSPATPSIKAISSVAIPGCLQLILSVSGLSPPPTSSSASPQGGRLAAELYASLPSACRTGKVTIQIGLTATHFSAPHGSSADGGHGAALNGALQQQAGVGIQALVAQQQEEVQIEALAVQPLVLQSGLMEAQVVDVQLPRSCVGGGLKVVAVADAAGVQVHTVEEVVVAAAAICRLALPPGLDPGPVALYAVSSEGLLLASCSTAALPPPATQELHQLLLDCTPSSDSDSNSDGANDVRAEVAAVLHDLAAVWGLSRSAEGAAVEAGDLVAYFGDNGLGSCKAALEQQLHLTPPPLLPLQPAGRPGQLLRSAAASAKRLVGSCCNRARGGSGDQAGAAAAGPAGQPTAAGVAAAGQGGWCVQYSSRLGSLTAAMVLVIVCAASWASLQNRRKLMGQSGPSPLRTGGLIVLHSLVMMGPHLWVAVWGPMRTRRGTVVALQAAAKSALYLAPVLWPAMSGEWASAEHAPAQLLVAGVMRPAINQVHWPLQLLMTTCELACMRAGCRWTRPNPAYGMQRCRPVSLPWHVLIVLTASAVSILVRRLPRGLGRPPPSRSSAAAVRRHKSD